MILLNLTKVTLHNFGATCNKLALFPRDEFRDTNSLPGFLFIVTGDGLNCILHVVGASDVVAVKHSTGLVTADAHGNFLRDASPNQITNARTTKIVGDHAFVFFPFVTFGRNHFGELAESRRNACLLKFLAEIRRVEHRRIILAELLFVAAEKAFNECAKKQGQPHFDVCLWWDLLEVRFQCEKRVWTLFINGDRSLRTGLMYLQFRESLFTGKKLRADA